jgi:cellulose synthase (UDP-forming)
VTDAVIGLVFLLAGCAVLVSSGDNRLTRSLVCAISLGLGLYYFDWRLTATIDHRPAWTLHFIWPVFFLCLEVTNYLKDAWGMFTMTRTSNHSPTADRWERILRERGAEVPRVDVFIPTFREPRELLRRTLLGAKALDWPNLRIFVLDDGARPWLEALCREEGVRYIARHTGQDAKAGNYNNALAITRDMDPAPFILCLDADFVPFKNLLYRTMGLLLEDAKVAIVQTPQYFFNPDPSQANLMATKEWVDDQRFFFDVLQPSMDAFDTSFCVGTSCVWRRAAVDAIGGVPVGSVIEDVHLSFKLMAHGWITRYLNERLSNGLSAETIGEFVVQRVRWGIGCTQALWVPYGPLALNKLTWAQRLQYLATIAYWMNMVFLPVAMLTAPMYWFFGVNAIRSELPDLLAHLLPYLTVSLFFRIWIGRRRVLPLIGEAIQLVIAFDVSRAVYPVLWGGKPKISRATLKDISTTERVVNWRLMSRVLPLLLLNIAGPVLALHPDWRGAQGIDGDHVNLMWSLVNIAIIGLAVLLCIDLPRRRRHDRFTVGERVPAVTPDGIVLMTIDDISVSGARLRYMGPSHERLEFTWRGAGPLRARRVMKFASGGAYEFDHDAATERALTVEIYTGGLQSTAVEAQTGSVFRAILARLCYSWS